MSSFLSPHVLALFAHCSVFNWTLGGILKNWTLKVPVKCFARGEGSTTWFGSLLYSLSFWNDKLCGQSRQPRRHRGIEMKSQPSPHVRTLVSFSDPFSPFSGSICAMVLSLASWILLVCTCVHLIKTEPRSFKSQWSSSLNPQVSH